MFWIFYHKNCTEHHKGRMGQEDVNIYNIHRQNSEILRLLLDTFKQICALPKFPSKIIRRIRNHWSFTWPQKHMFYMVIPKLVRLQRASKFILILWPIAYIMIQLTKTDCSRTEDVVLFYFYLLNSCVKHVGWQRNHAIKCTR